MKKFILLFAGLAVALFTASCELGGGSDDDGGGSSGPDDLDISQAITLDHNQRPAQNAAITRQLHSANKEGGEVVLSFDSLDWPRQGKVDGGVYIYWKSGDVVQGGLFDFHGVGQTVKTLDNIPGGYLGGKKPAPGQEIFFCIVNLDGSERTNVKKSANPW